METPQITNRNAQRVADEPDSPGRDFDIKIPDVPVTQERIPFKERKGGKNRLENAGTARANIAASAERTDGTLEGNWTSKHRHETVLQQHCAFFDRDNDGVIWPNDTYYGFYTLGYGVILSVLAVLIIHSNFSYPTLSGYLPDPMFRIYTANIHKDKHGSDSGTYDNEGRFIPQKFEDIFAKYSKGKDGLNFVDVTHYLNGQRVILDPVGWFGAIFEWGATYILLWPEDGLMRKEDIRRIYDGSLFYAIAEKRKQKQKQTKSHKH